MHQAEDLNEVYMFLRVFRLDSDGVGMCVYMDPEQMRQEGKLVFHGQTWAVTPGEDPDPEL